MRLTHLSIEGVRSIVKPINLELPEFGLFLIKGENGVGKSSILMAISHLLGFCPIPSTGLQSWFTEKKFQVVGRFESGGDSFTVSRGKETWVLHNGEQIKGPKAVDAKLLELFNGLEPDLRRLLTYRPQRKPGMFLSLPDAKKKEFLSAVIPELARYEKAIEASSVVLEKLEDEERSAGAALEYVTKVLDSLRAPVEPVEPDLSYQLSKIEALETEISGWQDTVKSLRDRAESAVDTLDLGQLEKDLKQAYEDFAQTRDKTNDLNSRVFSLKSQYQKLDELKRALLKCVEHNKLLKNGKCPTCIRSWDSTDEALKRGELEQSRLIAEVKRLMALPETITQYEAEASDYFKQQNYYSTLATQLSVKIQSAKDTALSDINVGIANALQRINTLQSECSQLKSSTYTIQSEYKRARELYIKDCDLLAVSRNNVVASRDNYNVILGKLNVERDCLALAKGFFNSIFDDILVDISYRTNKILGKVDNVADVTIDFRSTYETAKKVIHRRITPYVTIRGREAELEYGPSGGMYSSVELAVDLAVAEVVAHRSGFKPGFLILDEPFTGVSIKSKEAALEVLQAWAQERLVIVVDHEGSFQGLFSNAIEVVSDNGTTTVRKTA
jgi:DNA repair exonuclease SbcCD ATPase subunit